MKTHRTVIPVRFLIAVCITVQAPVPLIAALFSALSSALSLIRLPPCAGKPENQQFQPQSHINMPALGFRLYAGALCQCLPQHRAGESPGLTHNLIRLPPLHTERLHDTDHRAAVFQDGSCKQKLIKLAREQRKNLSRRFL
jgi:hypothetical protein